MTLVSKKRLCAGFTLMEMTVILAVLTIITAAVVPTIVSVQASEQLKSTEATIARLPDVARNEAAKDQCPVRLRFDGSSVIEEELPLNGTVTQISEVSLGSNIQVDQTQKNYVTVDSAEWNWTAYPDGTSDIGGVQFSVDSETRSLIIPASGDSIWTTGPLPDESQNQWTAGQLLLRSTT
jgi:Tfp pilus assembly protein FimT